MNNIETLKQLVESGEKATQGVWKTAMEINGQDMPYIFNQNAFDTYDNVIARFDYSRKDRDFILQSANSREALKGLIADYERMEEALKSARDVLKLALTENDQAWFERNIRSALFYVVDGLKGEGDEQGN